ncbi:helicase RepA family protein [Phaeobacter inhibens]|uniref:AAA family ATPase n=1 Tax=Phaeobacter inhibens TaxID=221822 RepID=UPI0021A68F04|nr:helicase RepA family protein [Phaeobacter inhibens]UWR92700.1 helicase RepA family protein [Phaeobacter inhibens]
MTTSNTQSNAATGFADGSASNAAAHKPDLDKKYIVKHWLQPGHVGMLAAPPAHGKTAIVAALCANLALGHSFAGLNVRRTAIYYLAPEDPVGVKDRAYPYLSGAPAATTHFYVVDKTPDFLDEQHIEGIIEDVVKMKVRAQTETALVVVDTTNLSIGNADENSSSAMGVVMLNAHRIAREAGCYVLFIHHTSHADSSRGRGSSAFGANADDTFLLQRPKQDTAEKTVLLTPTKQKGVQLQSAISFRIDAFKVGQDSEGDDVTVPMAVPLESKTDTSVAPANSNRAPQVKSSGEARKEDMLRVLTELHHENPEAWHEVKLLQRLAGDSFNSSRKKADSLRVAVNRALALLVEAGKVEANERRFRLLGEAAGPVDEPGQHVSD